MILSTSFLNFPKHSADSVPMSCEEVISKKLRKIRISIEHGRWDRENKKCVDEKGWCKIAVDIVLDKPAPGKGYGEIWYENGHLNWVAFRGKYTVDTFNNCLGGPTYNMPVDFTLPDDICDELGIDRGYTIRSGSFDIHNAGEGYAPEDRKIVF